MCFVSPDVTFHWKHKVTNQPIGKINFSTPVRQHVCVYFGTIDSWCKWRWKNRKSGTKKYFFPFLSHRVRYMEIIKRGWNENLQKVILDSSRIAQPGLLHRETFWSDCPSYKPVWWCPALVVQGVSEDLKAPPKRPYKFPDLNQILTVIWKHSNCNNICFIWLQNLARYSVHCTDAWITLGLN